MVDDDHKYNEKETEQRLQKMLKGAFSGPPTLLKDIPKKSGKSRTARKQKPHSPPRRRQRKNRAA